MTVRAAVRRYPVMAWNPLSPESWGRRFGMVPVPLFGSARSRPGKHVILLDGQKASFALFIGEQVSLLGRNAALSWAWSSNVLHAVVVDPIKHQIHSKRWDDPEDGKLWRLPSESDA